MSDATPNGVVRDLPTQRIYATARQAHLCDQRAKVLLNLFVVTLHLQSWSSAVTQRLPNSIVPISTFFGVVPSTLSHYARERDGDLCGQIDGSFNHGGSQACEQVLWDEINRSRNVAEAVLGSITQYLLPVLYGFLGAVAGLLRAFRRKVEVSLVTDTDRAQLQQGAILGALAGAVIGLFASHIGQADDASGLGISAMALLAGYNVDGLFRFLDDLSDRVFRPAPPSPPRK